MSQIQSVFFIVDTLPGPDGFALEIKLPDDSWGGMYNRPYEPFVFGYTENNMVPRFGLSGSWIYVEQTSGAEIYVIFEDQNYIDVSDPVLLTHGMTVNITAKYMRVYAVKRPGVFRAVSGAGMPPIQHTPPLPMTESRRVNVQFADINTWTGYMGPDGDPNYGVLKLSPVEVGISGVHGGATLLAPAAITTAHYDFLFYGVATLRIDPALVGTVTGGIYVSQFQNILNVVANGVATNSTAPGQIGANDFLAVYYKLTAAGVTAGAIPPDRKLSMSFNRFYNRSQTPFAVC